MATPAAEPSGEAADVYFLEAVGTPAEIRYDRFRERFDRQVLPRHANARLVREGVPIEDAGSVERAVARLKERKPAVVVTTHTEIARAVAKVMRETPLVILTLADPVVLGIIDDARIPNANVTGYTYYAPFELKHFELLLDCVPAIRNVGILADDFWATEPIARKLLASSQAMFGVEVVLFRASPDQLGSLQWTPGSAPIDAWFVPDIPRNRIHSKAIARLIRETGKPSIGGHESHVLDGGLMVYEPVRTDPWPRIADMVTSILSGVPAREIPVERPKHFRLAVNRAAARDLHLPIPKSILKRADEIAP